MIGTASFDIFDTLVTRTFARPEDLFMEVGSKLVAAGEIVVSAEEFALMRGRAEASAREGTIANEVSLRGIYLELSSRLGWGYKLLERAEAIELDVEADSLRVIPAGRDCLGDQRSQGKRVAFLSDMYLPSIFIREQLKRHHLWEDGDLLLISCEHHASKADASLFRILQDVAAAPITHFGNNKESDVVQASCAGVEGMYLPAGNLTADEELLADHAGATCGFGSHLAAAARLARLTVPVSNGRERAIRDLVTATAAPVLSCYVMWVLNQARERGIGRLYFLSRDGQILLQIAKGLSPAQRGDLDLRYLHASRRSWHPASVVANLGEEKLGWLCDDTSFLSVDSACARGGIEALEIQGVLEDHDLPAGVWERNLSPEERQSLRLVFSDPRANARLRQRAEELRAPLVSYLRQEGFYDGESWAIVDLGWNGRLQDSLADIMRATGGPEPLGFYFALQAGSGDHEGRGARHAYLYDRRTSTGLCETSWQIIPLLETFCAADHGTVTGFMVDGGQTRAVLREPVNEVAIRWGLALMQRSIVAFVTSFVGRPAPADLLKIRPALSQLLARVLERPSFAEALLWGGFAYEDDQTSVAPRQLAEPLTARHLVAAFRTGDVPSPHRVALRAASLLLTPPLLRLGILALASLRRRVRHARIAVFHSLRSPQTALF
jgi:FMN phosphatase YigB (HAD superfamily)